MLVIAAPDKFRGSVTAPQAADAMAQAARQVGANAVAVPLADGGEGTLEALGGPNRTSTVTGPLGEPIDADWRLDGKIAVVEMARASGLELAGGAEHNRPLDATTAGTGELIDIAAERGARRIVVGVGGSATTDGGLGALKAMHPLARFRGIELLVACDVLTRFVDAARVFGPQKGASASQIELLERRLERLGQAYHDDYGVDVTTIDRSGAAGGLAGGLAAVGAELLAGFDVIADEVSLVDHIAEADVVISGEGKLDDQSFEGKVVGGVALLAQEFNVPLIVVAGQVELTRPVPEGVQVVSLTERYGEEASMTQTAELIERVVREALPAHNTRLN